MIDDHVHLWRKEVVQASAAARAALRYFHTPEEAIPADLGELVEDLEEAGVRRAFLLAMDCSRSPVASLRDITVTTEEVVAAAREHPDLLRAFGSVDPRRADAVRRLEGAAARGELTGLKFHASAVAVRPDDAEVMFPLYAKAQDLGLLVVHHTGTTALGDCLIRYARPLYFDAVAQAFPDLPIILAHFGWPWMEECFAVLQRNPNLYTDISGWMPRYLPDALIEMLNGPLRERTLVGSDYPMLRPASWREDFEASLRPRLKDGVAEMLLAGNAERLLRR